MLKFNKNTISEKDKMEIEQEKRKTLVLQQTIIPKAKHHNLYKVDEQTGKVSLAKKEIESYFFDGSKILPLYGKVIIEEGYFYTSARDHIRAKKNYLKRDNGSLKKENQKYLNL